MRESLLLHFLSYIVVLRTFCTSLNRFEEKLKQQRLNAKRYNASKQQKGRKKKFFINVSFSFHLTLMSCARNTCLNLAYQH